MIAMQELVVPRSIPRILGICENFLSEASQLPKVGATPCVLGFGAP
jgi:hypothetical protein